MTRSSVCVGILFFLLAYHPPIAHAQTAADLQTQINSHNQQITLIQEEIAKFQKELDAIGKQKNTLQSTINALAISQKQLGAQLSLTQSKIDTATLELKQLTIAIGGKETNIASNESVVSKTFREIAKSEERTIIEQLMDSESLTEAWQMVERSAQFNRGIEDVIRTLKKDREVLADNREAVVTTKAKLVSLQSDLLLQKKSVDANKSAQQMLLKQTNNQESSYQKLVAQKIAAQKMFEEELYDLESQLNLIVNPGSLPKTGSGVLSWPFSASFMQGCAARKSVFGNALCITQYFGKTAFATANPQIYSSGGHDAIDFGTPIGTPIHAARGGTVLGTGNTDAIKGCYSFGKWVMIKHMNGLNSLYAHLSVIDVSPGQTVQTGQIIGLSGMTGYATGPHLHFGVYATEGTKIMALGDFRGVVTPCARAVVPVGTRDAKLNPLSYL